MALMSDSIPFGKYRGEPIEEVPSGYLTWLLEQEWLDGEVADIVRDELGERFGIVGRERVVERPITVPATLREHVDAILTTGFRGASLAAHPDKGGTDERMKGVLAARAWLSKNLR